MHIKYVQYFSVADQNRKGSKPFVFFHFLGLSYELKVYLLPTIFLSKIPYKTKTYMMLISKLTVAERS